MTDSTVLKRFGDLEEGDFIVGSDGTPVQVKAAYEEHVPEKMYRLEFEDGKTIDASGNHLWYVESSLDKSLHRKRMKTWGRLFGELSPEDEEDLLFIAEMEGPAETALSDMIEFMRAEDDTEKWRAVVRVAESIGPVMEETSSLEDLYSGERLSNTELRLYDGPRFAQQLLALSSKKHRSRWPVIVGRVLTTSDIANSALAIDLPDLTPLGPAPKASRKSLRDFLKR